MYKILFINLFIFLLASCPSKEYELQYSKTIPLDSTGIISVIPDGEHFWVSDSDNNRVIKVDEKGKVIKSFTDFERPMHLALVDGKLYVPEYSSDTITVLQGENRNVVHITDSLEAPAGVDIQGDRIAIADFYNHRIVYQVGDKNKTFGKKGKGKGEFHYPTDVQFVGDLIYVADAYNNRIQVFDQEGKYLKMYGEHDKMNAATGLFVFQEYLIVTDFENSRVLTYDLNSSKLLQTITDHLDKPTDVFVKDNNLYIANYHGKNIVIFTWKEKDKKAGKEYTSAYICPMHCEGSGSEEEGNCPVCKMDYVKNNK